MIDLVAALPGAIAEAHHPLVMGGHSTPEIVLWVLVLVSGLLGSLGAGYLLYVDTIVVHYTKFFKIIALGMLIFVVSAPIVFLFAVEFIHGAHAFAVIVISLGLYTLIRSDFRSDDDFEALFSRMPSEQGDFTGSPAPPGEDDYPGEGQAESE